MTPSVKEKLRLKPTLLPKLQAATEPLKEKTVHVVLAFHAHEPLWDLPGHLQRQQADVRVAQAVPPENWVRKRFKEGRNIYRDLLAFSKTRKIPVSLDISNDLVHQLRTGLPRTFEELQRAYREREIFPLYTTAHHTHAALHTPEDFREEVKWNEQLIHDVLGAPLPKKRVFFYTECSVEPRFFDLLQKADMDAILHPHLSPRKAPFNIGEDRNDQKYRPFLVGDKLLALPRHFRVSQEIWRPITLMYPQQVKYQGFMMGQYFVFDTEYRTKKFLEFPIERGQAIEMYVRYLREALEDAPEGGLILYLQDLELMDFGDVALELLEAAWSRIKPWAIEAGIKLKFSTPDDYLESLPKGQLYSKIDVHGMGWAPETRVLLRSDGHYPPLYAAEYKGIDPIATIWRKHPFIYWEPGKYLVNVFDWLAREFGIPRETGVHASLLSEEGYELARFPDETRVQLALRLMRQADNWGWQPSEMLNKRPFLLGLAIADALLMKVKFGHVPSAPMEKFDARNWAGLARLPEGLLDTRVGALRFGLERIREEKSQEPAEAFRQLDYAIDFREKAFRSAQALRERHAALAEDPRNPSRWKEVLTEVREYCRNFFLSLDHIQRTWIAAGETDLLIESMYRYLYDLYPPLFPEILEQVDSGASAPTAEGPRVARLLQFTIPADSEIASRPLSELATAPDTLIVMVRRGTSLKVPKGDTVLLAGDRITIATSHNGEPTLDQLVHTK